jgi:hypothetical protein
MSINNSNYSLFNSSGKSNNVSNSSDSFSGTSYVQRTISRELILKVKNYEQYDLSFLEDNDIRTHNKDPPFVFNYLYI